MFYLRVAPLLSYGDQWPGSAREASCTAVSVFLLLSEALSCSLISPNILQPGGAGSVLDLFLHALALN